MASVEVNNKLSFGVFVATEVPAGETEYPAGKVVTDGKIIITPANGHHFTDGIDCACIVGSDDPVTASGDKIVLTYTGPELPDTQNISINVGDDQPTICQ